QITNGLVQAPGGRVNLVSAASSGELTFDAAALLAQIDLTPGAPALGDVALSNSGISVNGPGGGRVSVRAGTFEMNASEIAAATTGATDGLGIDIIASGAVSMTGSAIVTDSSGAGKAGPVNVTASAITIDGTGQPALASGI